jgi:hypothetical protein
MPYQPPKPVAAPLLAGLGLVITRWAYIDFLMGEFLSFLLEANPAMMYVVTGNVSASTISDWIRTILAARYIPDDPPAEIMALLTTIDELRAERNGMVHGLWERGNVPGTALVQTVRWERTEILKTELTTKGDLKELAILIDAAGDGLVAIGRRYGFPVMPPKT